MRLTLNNFTFGTTTDDAVIRPRSMEGFTYPTTRHVIEDLPSLDGAHFVISRFGRRRLAWEAEIIEDRYTARRNMLPSQGALKTLYIETYDSLNLQTDVEVVSITSPYTAMEQIILIETVAPDYRLYSQTLSTQTTGTTEGSGGTAIPTPIPMDLSSNSGNPKLSITNNGNVNADPTFRVTGPGTNFTIQNISGGSMQLNLTLVAGEFVDINVKDRTALKGGSQNVYGSVAGDWWQVIPGTQQVHFVASSGSDSGTQLKVDFRDAYLGF